MRKNQRWWDLNYKRNQGILTKQEEKELAKLDEERDKRTQRISAKEFFRGCGGPDY